MTIEERHILKGFQRRSLFENTVKCYPQGVSFRRVAPRAPFNSDFHLSKQSLRGNIRGFSSDSALRLRRALLSMEGRSPFRILGITLTLPWRGDFHDRDSFLKVVEDYKKAFNRFCVAFRRRFPASCAIFRHELQQRRAPHCHMVFYLSGFDFHLIDRGRNATLNDLKSIIFGLWSNSLVGFNYDLNVSGFVRRGVKLDLIDPKSNLALIRYLCDHASKGKVSQLGYSGKQWGFINRKFFLPVECEDVSFSSIDEKTSFLRELRKLCRFKVKADCCFSYKLTSKLSANKSVIFVSSQTVHLILSAVRSRRVSCFDSEFDKVGLPGYYPIRPLPP